MDCYLYWYHLDTHTDITKEGYVGITTQPQIRDRAHRRGITNAHLKNAFAKYGARVKKTYLAIASLEHCLFMENAVRPVDNIGWNIAAGGGLAPDCTGRKHSEETKRKISASNIGKTVGAISPFRGKTDRWDKAAKKRIGDFHRGKVISDAQKQLIKDANSGAKCHKAQPVLVWHKDALDNIMEFGCVLDAAKALGVNYPSLKSHKNRAKGKTANRLGWFIKDKEVEG